MNKKLLTTVSKLDPKHTDMAGYLCPPPPPNRIVSPDWSPEGSGRFLIGPLGLPTRGLIGCPGGKWKGRCPEGGGVEGEGEGGIFLFSAPDSHWGEPGTYFPTSGTDHKDNSRK
jgi:hypothetical protein